jgi:uncharacterized protein YdeI (YjbR/CyaY-like superfamily)
VRLEPHDVTFFATPADLRSWFDDHHDDAEELWVGFHKKGSGMPSVTWPEAVDEALCVGWIDGVRMSVDPTSYAIRFTPRRARSIWSAVNTGRVAALEAEGRMRPAGRVAFEARSAERTAIYSYERETAALSEAELERFRAEPEAWAWFDAAAPSYRRAATHWVVSAKRPETRLRRLETLIEDSAAGRTVAPFSRRSGAG